jgi:hypothetical protein
MKIIFVREDLTVLVTTPDELTLVQVKEGEAALAIYNGTNEAGEQAFTPLITYPVNLMPVPEEEELESTDAVDGPDGSV